MNCRPNRSMVAGALAITSLVLACLGILAALRVPGLAHTNAGWVYFELASLACMVVAVSVHLCSRQRQNIPVQSEVTVTFAEDPILIAAQQPSRDEASVILSIQNFCSAIPADLQLPSKQKLDTVHLNSLLSWTQDEAQKNLIEQGIGDLNGFRNFDRAGPDFLVRIFFSKKTLKDGYQETIAYLKGIIYLIHEEERRGKDCGKIKKYITKELSHAFTECAPTWLRCAQNLYNMMYLRNINLQSETITETQLQLIVLQTIHDYKEEVICNARQLDSYKDQQWHFLSYFVSQVGPRVGLKKKNDFLFSNRLFSIVYHENKNDDQLVEWFLGLVSAETLIDYFYHQLQTEKIEYKDLDGSNFFLSFIQSKIDDESDSTDNYHDENFVPNRAAIQFILKQFGIII